MSIQIHMLSQNINPKRLSQEFLNAFEAIATQAKNKKISSDDFKKEIDKITVNLISQMVGEDNTEERTFLKEHLTELLDSSSPIEPWDQNNEIIGKIDEKAYNSVSEAIIELRNSLDNAKDFLEEDYYGVSEANFKSLCKKAGYAILCCAPILIAAAFAAPFAGFAATCFITIMTDMSLAPPAIIVGLPALAIAGAIMIEGVKAVPATQDALGLSTDELLVPVNFVENVAPFFTDENQHLWDQFENIRNFAKVMESIATEGLQKVTEEMRRDNAAKALINDITGVVMTRE